MRHLAFAAVPSPEHDLPGHPEHAGRVDAILAELARHKLLSAMDQLAVDEAPLALLARVHDPGYLAALAETAGRPHQHLDADTYVTPESWSAARRAAGAAVAAVDAVLSGAADAGLSLARPPGHHATAATAMGFCLLNNVAIAARRAQAQGIERVMIVDFDVHHGNGTQDIFYADDTVFYLSTHQQGIYPGTGAEHEVGAGAGRGYTLNVPLPAMAGDAAFSRILDDVLRPAAERFRPELVLASAGFDAHFRDPLAMLQLTGPGFHALAVGLADIADAWAGGRLAFILEGGYDLPALANGVVNVIRALRGEPADETLGAAPVPEPDLGPLLARCARRVREA